ncbi:MAG: FAD-binding protein [Candidatus Binatia bacterium]|nr:MAG: FAD-binding protein [Candidatus Binatia bacterium]
MQPRSLIGSLRRIVGDRHVLVDPMELRVYECDGYTLEKSPPEIVVLPGSTEEVRAVVELLFREGIPFVPRGAGTGLSGGALPRGASVVLCTSRMTRILDVDPKGRRVVVEAGVVNSWVSRAAAPYGLFYAPDPSSQPACTIGGNIAENSGGPHTLKYGVTTNHVLGVELVLPSGEVVWLGGAAEETLGYDLLGLVVGSEGTFGIVTKAVLKLSKLPQETATLLAVFSSVDDATRAVSGIVASGIVPAALELMDRKIIDAVEAAYGFGFPTDAGAVLIVELDGRPEGVSAQLERTLAVCRTQGARELRVARDEKEREALWKSRKRAFGAVGRLAPNYCTQDGVVPRTRLSEILRFVEEVGRRHGIEIGNVFHAGDGNIHPILLYDERRPEEVEKVRAAGREILEACIAMGGSITGEHGIGVEKMEELRLLFSEDDLAVQRELRRVFDPLERSNPGKIFAMPGGCVETRRATRLGACKLGA